VEEEFVLLILLSS